ncbi:MAG: NADPH-dependent F420 reductase [Acidobacteriota bacterium]
MKITVVGAGSVGRALGTSLAAKGHDVVFAVRDPSDARYTGLTGIAALADAAIGSDVVVLAVPADGVTSAVSDLHLTPGQAVIDATNAVRTAVPGGHATMADLVSSLVPAGVAVAKAFNTVGAEHLGDGRTAHGGVFLPIAGDPDAVELAMALASDLGFEAVALGGREQFGMVEDHARLWIHLAFGCGWGRDFAFTVTRS